MGLGVADNFFYIVMPLLTGSTLTQKLTDEQQPMALEEIAGYLNQLSGAIDYAHQRGVIHADIKPSNVLIDEQGDVYLVDFGIAHLFDSNFPISPESNNAKDKAPLNLTGNEKIYGTAAYMAPERFQGEQAGPASDIYSLGVMLYQLVTAKLPFTAATPYLMGMKHLNEVPPSPHSLRPDLPEPAEAAILKALAREPADRFASASALATAFDDGIKGQWVEGLQPVPLKVPPGAIDSEADQPTVANVVPVPADPDQPNPLVLSPAAATSAADIPFADQPTQANPTPAVFPPQASSQNTPLLLLWGAVLVAAIIFIVLLAQAVPAVFSSSGSSPQPTPASTSTTEGSSSGGSGAMTPTTQPAGGSTSPPLGQRQLPQHFQCQRPARHFRQHLEVYQCLHLATHRQQHLPAHRQCLQFHHLR